MRRTIAICMLLTLSGPALAETQADRPRLKTDAIVSGNLVRIGDLVEHAGDAASVAIFRAPDLGYTGTVPVDSVLAALRPHGLTDVDAHGVAEIVVTRSSRSVTAREIETSIVNALAGQHGLGKADNLSLRIDQTLRTIHLESSAKGTLEVVRLGFDPRRQRFDVVFDIPGSAILKRTPLHLSGTVIETREFVTPVRAIQRGQIVTRSHVAIERRPRREVTDDVLTRIESVIGLAARRSLRSGAPLRQTDLMPPELVQRNDTVTLLFQVPGMLLTVRGKALDSGARGAPVSVLNLQSKRTVHGIVTGPGRVTVATSATRVASAAVLSNPAAERLPSE